MIKSVLACLIGCALFAGACAAQTPVTITVDRTRPGNVIPADFVGLSFETRLLLPDATGHRYFNPGNAPLIAMFHTLGIKSLRIGGNTSDTPSIPIPDQADIDSLFSFAKAANVQVIYTLRLREQTDPAADVKIAQFIMDHYRDQLSCLAVGNEPNIYDKDYTVYRKLVASFYAAILAAEPDAMFCGPSTTPGKSGWSHDFTLDFGHFGHLRFLSQHSYPGNSATTIKVAAAGRDQMLSPNFVKSYETFYQTFGPAAEENHVPFRLEETNNYFHGGAKDVSDTQAAALWGLDYMYWWAWHGASGLNFHTGDTVAAADRQTPCRYALFWTSPKGYSVHPLGYAVEAFSLGMGKLVPAAVAGSGALNLNAYATIDEAGKLTVTIINKEHGPSGRGAVASIDVGGPWSNGRTCYLAAPGGDVAATSGITLGGAEIGDDGAWAGKWTNLDPGSSSGPLAITVPAATAVLVQMDLSRP